MAETKLPLKRCLSQLQKEWQAHCTAEKAQMEAAEAAAANSTGKALTTAPDSNPPVPAPGSTAEGEGAKPEDTPRKQVDDAGDGGPTPTKQGTASHRKKKAGSPVLGLQGNYSRKRSREKAVKQGGPEQQPCAPAPGSEKAEKQGGPEQQPCAPAPGSAGVGEVSGAKGDQPGPARSGKTNEAASAPGGSTHQEEEEEADNMDLDSLLG
jgi:hypothetical protein